MQQIPALLAILACALCGCSFHASASDVSATGNAEAYTSELSDSYTRSFREASSNANTLVLTDEQSHHSTNQEGMRFVLEGDYNIQEFLDLLEVDEERSAGASCKCIGDYRFTLLRNEVELASVTYHHHSHLRRCNGDFVWKGDAVLTEISVTALCAWFASKGCQELMGSVSAETSD